jgi:hypothetical protein
MYNAKRSPKLAPLEPRPCRKLLPIRLLRPCSLLPFKRSIQQFQALGPDPSLPRCDWELAGLFGCSTERGTTPQATACRTIDLDSTAGRRWVQLAVFAAALGLLIATMSRNVRPYDEGLILFGSARVQSGDIPYRDFYANYGPASSTLWRHYSKSSVHQCWLNGFGICLSGLVRFLLSI